MSDKKKETEDIEKEEELVEKAEAETVAEEAVSVEEDVKAEGEEPVVEEEKVVELTPLEKAQADVKLAQERYLRTLADFDNFKKRTIRDREDLFKQAAKDIIKDILPTIDDLSLALDKAENKEDPFVAGVKMVYDNLIKSLGNHGATPIDSIGEPFDANYHDALAQLPNADVEEGYIANEVKRGWLLNGKLLRAAQVVVSSGKPE